MIEDLSTSIDEALNLLREYGPISESTRLPKPSALVGLVDQCKAMCAKPDITDEPIRTIHHFACTGGTVISKCLAAMPNTQLLSEIDPLSDATTNPGRPIFAPTDLIAQARQGTRNTEIRDLIELFLASLDALHKSAKRKGLRLILRDHSHSQFCTAQDASSRPTLREILQQRHKVFSIVTVRDPIQSYAALRDHNWIHFGPPTFDEYCNRYLSFLHRHKDIPVFKYESFVHEPGKTMHLICAALELPYQERFEDLLDVFKLTGDSGRSGPLIARRERRAISDALQEEIASSDNHKRLKEMLQYDR